MKIAICDKRCRSCYYSIRGSINGARSMVPFWWCGYILHTGKPRPCPAGAECTKYNPRGGLKT